MNIWDKIYHLQTLSNSDLIKNMKLISEVQKELINIIDIYYIEWLWWNLKDKKDVDDILQVLAYESNLLEIFKHVKIHLDYLIKSSPTILYSISNFNLILNLLRYWKKIESDYNKFWKSVNNIYSTDYISWVINWLNNNEESIRLIDGYIQNIKKWLNNIEAHHQYLQEQKLNIDNLLLENAQNKDLEILSWLIKKKDELKKMS